MRLLAATALFLLLLPARAQDLLYLRSGKVDTVNVEEVTELMVSYYKLRRPGGPLYRISREDVLRITYANDSTVELDRQPARKARHDSALAAEKAYYGSMGRNIVSINALNLLNCNLNLTYERMVRPKFGIRYSINTLLVDSKLDITWMRWIFSTGLDFNFYVYRRGRLSYYVGPSLRVARLCDNYNTYTPGYGVPAVSMPAWFNCYGLLLNNGLHIQHSRRFSWGVQVALGAARYKLVNKLPEEYDIFGNNFTGPTGILAFNLGYRF